MQWSKRHHRHYISGMETNLDLWATIVSGIVCMCERACSVNKCSCVLLKFETNGNLVSLIHFISRSGRWQLTQCIIWLDQITSSTHRYTKTIGNPQKIRGGVMLFVWLCAILMAIFQESSINNVMLCGKEKVPRGMEWEEVNISYNKGCFHSDSEWGNETYVNPERYTVRKREKEGGERQEMANSTCSCDRIKISNINRNVFVKYSRARVAYETIQKINEMQTVIEASGNVAGSSLLDKSTYNIVKPVPVASFAMCFSRRATLFCLASFWLVYISFIVTIFVRRP